jgi:predicted Rossmann fold nucleotide-binding protein DprA/Smf involved in DNA uptake
MRNRGECVVSGFSSKLEQDVLHFLLKGSQPIIVVLARRMYRNIPDGLKEPLAQNRLLIISVSNAVRQSKVTAMARNRYVCEMADEILFVGVTEQSSLYAVKKDFENNNNRIRKEML